MLLGDRDRATGSDVIRRTEQKRVVVPRDQLLGNRRRDGWPALVVRDVEVEPVADPVEGDAALAVDPLLAVEETFLGHLAGRGLAAGEGKDDANRDSGAGRRRDEGGAGRAGGRQGADRDQGREGKRGPPHVG